MLHIKMLAMYVGNAISALFRFLACDNDVCLNPMQFLAAMAQVVFGGSALWIAFLQWKLSKNKSKFELYEKRYEAYKELKKFLGSILSNAKVETKDLISFKWKFEEHFFLFEKDVHNYVKLIYEKSLEHRRLGHKIYGLNSLPIGAERNKVVDEQHEILTWLIDQSENSKEHFEKYLRIK